MSAGRRPGRHYTNPGVCLWEDCGATVTKKWCDEHREAAYKANRAEAHLRRMSDPGYADAKRRQSRDYQRAVRSMWTDEQKALEHQKRRLSKYGLTIEQYDAILSAQGGRCAICSATEPGSERAWHVDHDHEAGHVRALLCHHCNVGLGNFRDDPELLIRAAKYLRTHHQLRLVA